MISRRCTRRSTTLRLGELAHFPPHRREETVMLQRLVALDGEALLALVTLRDSIMRFDDGAAAAAGTASLLRACGFRYPLEPSRGPAVEPPPRDLRLRWANAQSRCGPSPFPAAPSANRKRRGAAHRRVRRPARGRHAAAAIRARGGPGARARPGSVAGRWRTRGSAFGRIPASRRSSGRSPVPGLSGAQLLAVRTVGGVPVRRLPAGHGPGGLLERRGSRSGREQGGSSCRPRCR